MITVFQTMVIPEEQEGRGEDDPALSRDATPANRTTGAGVSASRRGGVPAPAKQRKVTVPFVVTHPTGWSAGNIVRVLVASLAQCLACQGCALHNYL